MIESETHYSKMPNISYIGCQSVCPIEMLCNRLSIVDEDQQSMSDPIGCSTEETLKGNKSPFEKRMIG